MTMTESPATTMSVIATRRELIESLAAVSRAASKRDIKPILQCVRMETVGSDLQLDCTNLESSIRCICRAVQVVSRGECAVSPFDLLEWLNRIDDETVEMQIDGDNLRLKASSGTRTLYTQNVADFPPIPTLDKESMTITMPLAAMRTAHAFVAHASDKDSLISNNKAIFIEKASAKSINIVSTQGHMLAAIGMEATLEGSGKSAMIPSGFADLAMRSMPDDAEEITIGLSENAVRIQCDDVTAWSGQLEGTYVPWKDVIPKDSDTMATVDRESFIKSVRQVAVAREEGSYRVRAKFSKSGISLSARSTEKGEADARFPCKVEGPDLEIGFNADFVVSALSGMVGNEVSIHCTKANRPIKFTCGPMTEIVMPVNLKSGLL